MARKSKDESLVGTFCALIVDHQIGLSVNLLLLLFLTHLCFPRARQNTRMFFELSYYEPRTDRYTQGWNDLAFVAFWTVVFTGVRVFVMDYVLRPLAIMGGIHRKKAIVRFAEQGWSLLYYITSWTVGMYIMYHSDYWFHLKGLWTDFPHTRMTALMKWYYLVQLGFWFQQILVVNIEEKRKDYTQMFAHHIITTALIVTSYGYFQTRVGNVILCIMDGVDILLPAAKLLRYLNYRTACDFMFGLFILAWFVARHCLFLAVCWSIYVDVPIQIPYGCYDPVTKELLTTDGGHEILRPIMQSILEPGSPVCLNAGISYAFLVLLLGLQVITLLWFGMILRVAWKVIQGNGADDSRSDDEDEVEEDGDVESESEKTIQKDMAASTGRSLAAFTHAPETPIDGVPFEEEVGVEGLHLDRRTHPNLRVRRSASGNAGRATTMSASRDRKELLGRIGCDGPS